MAFCDNCGCELRDGAKFCPNCGAGKPAVNMIPNNAGFSGHEVRREQIREQYGDPTRAMNIPNPGKPEPTGLDKYGKFIGIGLLAIAIIDFFSDPAIVTILLSMAIIAGAIFCFSKKFKLKVFTILALILAVICLACGIGQAWQTGLFKMPEDKKESTATEDAGSGAKDAAADSGKVFSIDSDDAKTRDVTYGRITFALPEKYIEKANGSANEGVYYTKDDKAGFDICCLNESVPSPHYISPEVRTLVTDEARNMLVNNFDMSNVSEVNSEYENIVGLKGIKMSFTGVYNSQDVFCNMLFINDPDANNTIGVLQFYIKSAEDKYAKDFGALLDSAKLNGSAVAPSSGLSEPDSKTEAEQPETEKPAGGVDPDLKAFLDSYEAFVDEYVAFMKKYMSDPSNALSMIGEYGEIMQKYEDFAKKVDQYNTDEMSVEDAKYYLEVTSRCSQKMLDIL